MHCICVPHSANFVHSCTQNSDYRTEVWDTLNIPEYHFSRRTFSRVSRRLSNPTSSLCSIAPSTRRLAGARHAAFLSRRYGCQSHSSFCRLLELELLRSFESPGSEVLAQSELPFLPAGLLLDGGGGGTACH